MKTSRRISIILGLTLFTLGAVVPGYSLEDNHKSNEVSVSSDDVNSGAGAAFSDEEILKNLIVDKEKVVEDTDLFTICNPEAFVNSDPLCISSLSNSLNEKSVIEFQREDGSIARYNATNEETEFTKDGEYHFNIVTDKRGIWKVYSLNGQRIKNDKLTFMSYDDIKDFDNVNNKEYREEQKRQRMNRMFRSARKQIIRYQGSDRIETAVEISKRNFSSANNVIVTNGWKPSDAIAATALAKNLNAPILYVNESNIPSSTKNEIERLGAKNVYVIGGVNSVSDDVKNQLYNSISSVQTTKRISGDDRAGTALEIAKETSKYGKGQKAFVVTGTSESDCLAISAASGENNYLMFYVVNGNLDYASRNYIQNNFSGVVVANGSSSVSTTVVNQLKNAGLSVSQISGYDSFDLSMKLSKNTGFYTTLHSVYLTSGNNVPDGVPGSVLAAKSGMPLMLVNGSNNKDDIVNYINNKDVDAVYILGGTNGVPADLENAINNGGGSTPNISEARNKIVQLAKAQLGKPYVWGASGPSSFDCSGLVYYVYKNAVNISVPRKSSVQATFGKYVSVNNLKPGDLIFWGKPVTHVGIYIGDGNVIHAPEPGQSVITKPLEVMNKYMIYNTSRSFLD